MTQDDGAPLARQAQAAVEPFLAIRLDDRSRVTLRLLSGADQDEFLGLAAASTGLHHPWMSLPTTPQEFQAYRTRFDHVTAESLLICVRGTGSTAGFVNINSIIRGRFQNGSLSYAAFAPTAGRGYMAEGLGLVLRYAFEQLRLHRLDAQIQPGNHASIRLVRRLGFRHEGYSPGLSRRSRFASTAGACWRRACAAIGWSTGATYRRAAGTRAGTVTARQVRRAPRS